MNEQIMHSETSLCILEYIRNCFGKVELNLFGAKKKKAKFEMHGVFLTVHVFYALCVYEFQNYFVLK